jgi:hypothetical protein
MDLQYVWGKREMHIKFLFENSKEQTIWETWRNMDLKIKFINGLIWLMDFLKLR